MPRQGAFLYHHTYHPNKWKAPATMMMLDLLKLSDDLPDREQQYILEIARLNEHIEACERTIQVLTDHIENPF